MPCGVPDGVSRHGVPFGFAQGRLSTAVVLRIREAQLPLRTTDCWNSLLRLPIFMVTQEVVFVPVIHGGFQEQPAHTQVSHLLEAAVGGVDDAADDAEALPLHLLAEQVVFGEENLLVKSTELAEFFQVEQHEHSGSEGMMETGQVLEEIVGRVKKFVDPVAVAAQDVRGDTVKLLALGEFDGATHDGRMRQFDIGIEKENVGALGVRSSQVAANGGHSAADHADVQAVAEAENNLASAVG